MKDPKETTLLIVDDEPALRNALAFDFKRKGFRVLEAENGRSALEIIKVETVDIVISDIKMPNGTGLELLSWIGELAGRFPNVVLLSGFSDISPEQVYDKGACAVFPKPFDRKLLHSTVLQALDWENKWRERASEMGPPVLELKLRTPALGPGAPGSVINLGRGGIFLPLEGSFPRALSHVSFDLTFERGPVEKIEGMGIVRWVRSQTSSGLVSGCGVEFTQLHEICRKAILSLIQSLRSPAFIPIV